MPGKPDPANAGHVLSQLELAVALCRSGECHAMVTAPVHKGVINDAGIPFSGHTEFLGHTTDVTSPVMLLTSEKLKVALATTHLPLRAVPDAINRESLKHTLNTLHEGLKQYFGIPQPRISVLGLNPHAGEDGHLGNEEVSVIRPLCDEMRQSGLALSGPISGDTAFTPARRSETDAYLAMYHDQGLAVIKSEGFSNTVNVTLGLPIIRTSVDHGTAMELAGTGQVDIGSLVAAIQQATNMASEQ
jgi:4-hydroxythreonine-4-phosphate dehydrogenase